ncbi:glycosyltransferase [Candidatus Woesearchaeota archaeon]|nr:glycosyltransferase [Candidatus Woesearchaeota archaeon]
MKILIVTKNYYPTFKGGGEISVKLLADNLKKNGYHVEILSFDGKKEEEIDGIKVTRKLLDNKSSFLKKVKIQNYLRIKAKDVDIIHFYGIFFANFGGLLSLLSKTKKIVTLNNYPPKIPTDLKNPLKIVWRKTRKKISLFFMKYVNSYIPLSSVVKNEYLQAGFSNNKFHLIPNMIPDDFFVKKIKDRRIKKKLKILYVGTIYRHKGVFILLDSLKILLKEGKNIKLTIVGDGPEYNSLIEKIKDLNLLNNVDLTGFVNQDEIKTYYDKADLFIHPGIWKEPFGRTIIEAMARACPTIVSDIGAPPLILKNKKLVFEKDNPVALSKKIEEFISGKINLNNISRELYRKSQKYRVEKVFPEFIELYQSLVS